MSRPPLPGRPGGGGGRPSLPGRPGEGARPPAAKPPSQPPRPAQPSRRPSLTPSKPSPTPLQPEVSDVALDARSHDDRPAAKMEDVFIPPTVTKVAADGWSERYTMDGAPYYFNINTEAVSWDCPASLKEMEEVESEGGSWRWCPDPEEAWVPGREVEPGVYITNTGNRVKLTAKDPNWPIMMSSLRHLEEDLVMIDDMNEGLITHNLRERFKEDKIYTAIGTILVSVNPFKRLPLYMPSVMEKYYKSGGNKRLPPHPFQRADASYKDMMEFKKHQSILISGESGAGKTEATKQCLAYFAEVAGSETGIEQKIIEANPILEAFGNAKTGRNNNSSRFGKFMEIHFDKIGHIVGARTENYLLEKSRVVFQTMGERTYHIFYMLCVGCLQQTLGLSADMEQYRYLNQSGCTEVEGMDDSQEFDEVLKAMDILGFNEEEKDWIFETTAAVLLLGNLRYKFNAKQDAAVLENPELVQRISKLLRVDNTNFVESLISRWFVVRGHDPTNIPFKPDEAVAAADACAKAIYGRMFDWIVDRVNKSMVVPQGTQNFIGVLDIFGFEIFETNSFEQLCINFANEKLQQHFNEYTFKLEETVYQTEQIAFVHIEFIDNQPILDMIEKKPKGLLVQLDEEIVMPKGTDETWFNKISRDYEKTQYFEKVVKKKGHFLVHHYAGAVEYDSNSFLDKNRDALWADIFKCLGESKRPNTAMIFVPAVSDKKGRAPTLGGQFRGQLNNLMEKLRSTAPSYIRCVKPNSVKRPDIFDSVMSLQQLRYAGVFEAIKIRQQGYPFRYTHTEFLRRYKCLTLKDGGWIPLKARDAKGKIREILNCTKQDFSDVQIGRTMVLYRAPQQRVMELLRNLSLERVCLILQKWIRGCFARRFRDKLVKSRPVLLGAMQTRTSLQEATSAIEYIEGTVGTYSRLFPFKNKDWLDCQELKRQLTERKRVTGLCSAALPHDPETNFTNLERAVQAGLAISEYPGTPEQLKIFQDTKDLYDLTCNRRACRAELKRATVEAERMCLEEHIELAAQLGIPNCPEIAPAKAMVERCKKEEALCAELEATQATGGMLQWASGQGVIDAQTPNSMFQKASSFGMKTARGRELQQLCQYLHQLRTALKSSPWDGFENWLAVENVLANQPMSAAPSYEGEGEEEYEEGVGGVSQVASHPEVAWATDEVQFRARQKDVHEPLRGGITDLNEETITNFVGYIESNPYVGGFDQQGRISKLEEVLLIDARREGERIGACREALEASVASKDEAQLRAAIDQASQLPVDAAHAVALLELLVQGKILVGVKFHIDYGRRVEVGLILDDELAESTVAKVTSRSSGAEISITKSDIIKELETTSDYLDASLQHASQIEIVTDQGQRLVEQGKALLDLRRCLLARDWPNLDRKLSATITSQVEGPETNLAEDETAGRCTAADCLEGLRVAVEEVVNPSEEHGHPSEGTLASRLAQAERLEMKDLPEIVSGREMLDRIRNTRKELQTGLTLTQYEDTVRLAEEFNELYALFEASTKQLNMAIEMAKNFSYVTKETKEADSLLQEVTILWYLQEDLQSGGYYDSGQPQSPAQKTVVLEPITSHYNDYSGFPFVTKIGKYIVQKVYFILTVRSAIHTFCDNPENINTVVPAANEIGCPTTPELVSAQGFMQQLNDTRAAMTESEQLVKEDLLINASKMCEALFFTNADVERVVALKDLVIALNEESRKALWVLDKERMQKVINEANAIRLTTDHFEYIQILLDLGAMEWLKFEIKKAKELGEENRKIRLAIGMKDLTLDQFGHLFGLSSLKNMRSPENYASQKLLTLDRKKLAAGMLSFSKTPAHTSLIDFSQLVHDSDPQAHKLVQQLTKDSTRSFKNIMGYMMDKKYPYPTVLVQETIQLCLDQPLLRSEVYLQTIKQITNHPVPANQRKGYELLSIWCWQFPPQPDLDNILETYLRGVPEKSVAYLGRLRDVQYGGAGRTAPSPDQIEKFVKNFFTSASTKSKYEENIEVIQDSAYTDAFFKFETPKSLFQFDDEDARLKVV